MSIGGHDTRHRLEQARCLPAASQPAVALPPPARGAVSFYLPPRLHAHPPKPNNPDVYVDCSPALTAFVAQVG